MSNKAANNVSDVLPEWAGLEQHLQEINNVKIKDLFADNSQRFKQFHIHLNGLLFDFSKHKITAETVSKLTDLAKACGLEEHRDKMFEGGIVNTTEQRPALHTALRESCADTLEIDGENVSEFVQNTHAKIKTLSEKIRGNAKITDVVNIGIGGSDLGPRTVHKALKPSSDGPNIHYVSNVDGSALHQRLDALRAESTVFIISSKTFSTLETMTNAQTAKSWLTQTLGNEACNSHFIAVTCNPEAAVGFGVDAEHILPMRDWIGGRYSLWSGIGLSIAIANGFEVFQDLLAGATAADEHFKTAPLNKNIPVIMAMLGIWYRNFWNYPAHVILPYSHDLRDLPTYLQQLDMESNGKSVTTNGTQAEYTTSPIVFGESGTNAQHAFMQLMHQGSDIIPADFILISKPLSELKNHHTQLLANALAQSKALMDGQENTKEPHKNFPGNRPSSTLILDRLDAHHMGLLLALYEHKTFVQGVIWGINSFDQWGVELGKNIAENIAQTLENNNKIENSDSSTGGLLAYLDQKFIKS